MKLSTNSSQKGLALSQSKWFTLSQSKWFTLSQSKWFTLSGTKGFTLIEILVVMVIIGILSVIGLGSFSSSQMKGRDSKRKNDLRQVGLALEAYFNDKGQYPLGNGQIEGCGIASEQACLWGGAFVNDNGTTYMVELPSDPKGYDFNYQSNGTSYSIYARLENNKDIDVPKDSGEVPMVYPLSCGPLQCNFGLASSNMTLVSPVAE